MATIIYDRLANWNHDAAKREFELGRGRDTYVCGCGGNEVPALVNGNWYLYCYNHYRRHHRYVNLETDMVLSDDEAKQLGLG